MPRPTHDVTHRQPRQTCTLPLLALLVLAGCAHDLPTTPARSTPTDSQTSEASTLLGLQIGPLEGLTQAWHTITPATPLLIPRGTTLQLRCDADANARTQWTGADETQRDATTTWASARIGTGVHNILLRITQPDAEPRVYRCVIKGVAPTTIPSLREATLTPAPLAVSPESESSQDMRSFFAGSNAVLQSGADGTYETSVARGLDVHATSDTPAYDALIEWSLDGTPRALGSSTRITLDTPGRHHLTARLARSERDLLVDAYTVRILREGDRARPIQDGVVATFYAVTDPPGHEHDVTWRADTAAGTVLPQVAEPGRFSVVFEDTWTTRPDGQRFQWVGVRGDNAIVVQDQVDPVVYGVEQVGGEWWAYIRTRSGQPLIAAPFDYTTAVMDTSRTTILGYDEAGLTSLENTPNTAQIALLQSTPAQVGAFLWQDGFPNFPGSDAQRAILSRLSQILMYIVHAAVQFILGTTWTPDGCTNAPDFNFKDCCDDHDHCYCTGGNEAARKLCDQKLRDWIKMRGHPILARIYYWAVRAFGKSHFNYTS
jgi:hypothetical protein